MNRRVATILGVMLIITGVALLSFLYTSGPTALVSVSVRGNPLTLDGSGPVTLTFDRPITSGRFLISGHSEADSEVYLANQKSAQKIFHAPGRFNNGSGELQANVAVPPVARCISGDPLNKLEKTCTDSDGGTNSLFFGNVESSLGELLASPIAVLTDTCTLQGDAVQSCRGFGCALNEGRCDGTQATTVTLQCPAGCADGVCTPEPRLGIESVTLKKQIPDTGIAKPAPDNKIHLRTSEEIQLQAIIRNSDFKPVQSPVPFTLKLRDATTGAITLQLNNLTHFITLAPGESGTFNVFPPLLMQDVASPTNEFFDIEMGTPSNLDTNPSPRSQSIAVVREPLPTGCGTGDEPGNNTLVRGMAFTQTHTANEGCCATAACTEFETSPRPGPTNTSMNSPIEAPFLFETLCQEGRIITDTVQCPFGCKQGACLANTCTPSANLCSTSNECCSGSRCARLAEGTIAIGPGTTIETTLTYKLPPPAATRSATFRAPMPSILIFGKDALGTPAVSGAQAQFGIRTTCSALDICTSNITVTATQNTEFKANVTIQYVANTTNDLASVVASLCPSYPCALDLSSSQGSNLTLTPVDFAETSQCTDGTPIGACSTTRPFSCTQNAALTPSCFTCGCPQGGKCQTNGMCTMPIDISSTLLTRKSTYLLNETIALTTAQDIESEKTARASYRGFIVEFTADPLLAPRDRIDTIQAQDLARAIETFSSASLPLRTAPAGTNIRVLDEQRKRLAASLGMMPQSLGDYTRIFNGVALDITEEQARQLLTHPDVRAIYPNYIRYLFATEDISSRPEDTQRIETFDTPLADYTGTGVRIAILDTGIDYTHPDFGGCTTKQFTTGTCSKFVDGFDFVSQTPDAIDTHGHGTHVASIAAGNGATPGVAPGARLAIYQIFLKDGSTNDAMILAGLERAMDPNSDGDYTDRADIISMSIGGPAGQSEDATTIAVRNAVSVGSVVTIAAGNNGAERTINSPGNSVEAITVGASCRASQLYSHTNCKTPAPRIATFSSLGPSFEHQKPDLVAPGVAICAAKSSFADTDALTCVDDAHVRLSGTSMATPYVAGAAALLLEAHPDWTPLQIKQALKSTAFDIGYSRTAQGTGIIDIPAALRETTPLPIAILRTVDPKIMPEQQSLQ
ncbi:S8 family serine peptidase [Candidatus Woesearchaeota archaeon]|nr:S8 family serine peptidase [Candidatus Woesearchaeota archaeon]